MEQKLEAGAPRVHPWPHARQLRQGESLATEAANLIHHRLAELHSVAQLGALLGVSREHLSRSFKKHLGCSVWAFMTALRVERAKELLSGDMPVKQVAREVGFGSSSSFGRAFVRSLGVQPTQYRRNIKASKYAAHYVPTDRRHP